MQLTLAPVTADNWRDVADLAPTDEQRRFVASLGFTETGEMDDDELVVERRRQP